MGLYMKQQHNKSQLQDRIAKELQEKAKQKAVEADLPDGVEDSRYIEGSKTTGSYGWVWILLVVAIIAAAVIFIASTASR